MLAFWATLRVFREGKTRDYLLVGAAAGLSMGTKYLGVIILCVLPAVHFLRSGWGGILEKKLYWDFRLWSAIFICLIVFFITTPYAILDFDNFYSRISFQRQHYSTGHDGMEGDTLAFYLKHLWFKEGPISAMALVAMLYGLYKSPRMTAIVAVFPVVYFAYISGFVVRNARTLMPVLPFLFIMAADFLVRIAAWPSDANWRRWLGVGVTAGVLLLMVIPVRQSVTQGLRLTTVDGRETARTWISENLPADATVVIEYYAPYVDPNRFSVKAVAGMIDAQTAKHLADRGGYMVFSQGMFSRYFADPVRYAEQKARYEELFRVFDLVKTFDEGGYVVHIYRVGDRAITYYWLGTRLRRLGLRSKANGYFLRAADLDKRNSLYQYEAARAIQGSGDTNSSIPYLERIVETDAKFRDAMFLLAFAYQSNGRGNSAISKYRQFLENQPTHVQAHFNLAYALMNSGECRAAVEHFDRVLSLRPSYWEAHAHLAVCYQALGDTSLADRHMKLYQRRRK
jgi:hypothetical protein